jgi:hypothetical protein
MFSMMCSKGAICETWYMYGLSTPRHEFCHKQGGYDGQAVLRRQELGRRQSK